ncbi:MAG: O-antigen ligase family protein [Planctomycetota bacterium]
MLDNYDNLTLVLMAGIAAVGIVALLLSCWRHYELAIILALLSPCVSWLLYSNIPKTVEEQGTADTASYIRILLVFLVGCCGILQFIRSWFTGKVKCFPKYLVFFGMFILYAILSTGYSLDQKFTLIRSCEFLIFFMFLLGLHTWLDKRKKMDKAFNIFFWFIAAGILLNVSALIFFPGRVWYWRVPDRFVGLADRPNMFGSFCMTAYPILVWKFVTTRRPGKSVIAVLLCLTAGLHVLSGSRSSLLAAILGGVVWLSLSIKSMTLKHLVVCLVFTLALTLGVSVLLQTKPASLTRGDATITTLTGRTEFWEGCLLLIKEQPIQGYGYEVSGKVWEDPRFYREGRALWVGSAKSSLHNGYLSLTIGLGVVGLLLWLGFITVPIYQTLSLSSGPYKAFILTMIFQFLVLNFFESALSSGSQIYTSLVFWIFLIIAAKMPQLLGQPSHSKSLKQTYREADFERFNSEKIRSTLCAGHAGA